MTVTVVTTVTTMDPLQTDVQKVSRTIHVLFRDVVY